MKTNWNVKPLHRPGRLIACLLALSSLSLFACSGGEFYDADEFETPIEDAPLDAETLAAKQEQLTESLLADGHDPLEIEFFDESLVVQGDMLMHVDDALDRFSRTIEKQSQVRKQEHQGGRVSNEYNDRITVSISANVPTRWHSDVAAAMAQWNSVRGSRIHFSRKLSGRGHVHISMRDIGTDNGRGDYPRATIHTSNFKIKKERKPGPNVYLHPRATEFEASDRQSLVMHELGHTIGFDHTFRNSQERNDPKYRNFDGTQIGNTPRFDPNSVMVPSGFPKLAKLSIGDHIAAAKIYANGQRSEFECYPGQRACGGNARLSCLSTGKWNRVCTGSSAQRCNASGTGIITQSCEHGCSARRCNLPPLSSGDQCSWTFSSTFPGGGAGGLFGPVAEGRRCNRSNLGTRFTHTKGSTTTTYSCTKVGRVPASVTAGPCD